MSNQRPISWMALSEGTPVISSDGEEVGSVKVVVADKAKDIFSGINIKDGVFGAERFVPADDIQEITEASVTLRLTRADIENLDTSP